MGEGSIRVTFTRTLYMGKHALRIEAHIVRVGAIRLLGTQPLVWAAGTMSPTVSASLHAAGV